MGHEVARALLLAVDRAHRRDPVCREGKPCPARRVVAPRAGFVRIKHYPNRSRERSFAFSASISRSRAGAWVCSEVRRRRAVSETSLTARSNAASLACDGLLKPESLRTNCSAEA